MKDIAEIYADKRLNISRPFLMVDPRTGAFSGKGWVRVGKNKSAKCATVVWGSDEHGVEHVSVSFKDRCPTWDEMCIVKDVFWREEERCIQLHPKRSEYVNMVEHCLHIWRVKGAPEDWPFHK